MKVNQGSIGCQNCINSEKDVNFGLICQHKASMEGIEALKEFYKMNEVKECNYYEYNQDSVLRYGSFNGSNPYDDSGWDGE